MVTKTSAGRNGRMNRRPAGKQGWESQRLRNLVSQPESGVSVVCEERDPAIGEPGVLRLSCVTGGRFNDRDVKTPLMYERSRLSVSPEANTILISRSNTPALVGASAFVAQSVSNVFLPDTLWLLRQAPGTEVCMRWLAFVLGSSRYRVELQRIASGTSQSMKKIQKGAFLNLSVCVPPLPEQRKIAEILTTWDEALTQLDALIDAQERRKKGLMQQLLTGKKRLRAYAKSPWKKVRMGEVLKRVFRPIDWSPEMALSLVSLRRRCGGLFRRPDVLAADYKTQDLHELHADDFLISKRQVVHGAWGLVKSEFAGSHVSKEYAILVNTAPKSLHMPFFAWLCQTPRMIRLARVASTGVHIEKLIFDPEVFLRDSIRIPGSVEEQREIAAVLDAAERETVLLRDQRDAIDQQKRGLMQRLLTGRVRVK